MSPQHWLGPLHPLGLLSSILTARQWKDYPGNATTDAQGQAQIAPRYTPPAYKELDPNMSSVQLYVAKDRNDKLRIWMDASDVLKRAVIKSLGESVREIITIKTSRFQQITVAEIIERVRGRFGKLQKDTKTALNQVENDKHVKSRGRFGQTHCCPDEKLHQKRNGGIRCRRRRQSRLLPRLYVWTSYTDILKQFDFEHPDCTTITYAQIMAYVILHSPNLKTAQQAATRVQANIVTPDAYAALQLKTKQLRDDVQTLMRKRSSDNANPNYKKQKQKQNKSKTKDQTPTRERLARIGDEPIEGLDYCHNHGYQHSHTSSVCKVLRSDKKKYNDAMRRAKDPNHPPGGSTKVNGQDPTRPRKVVANLMAQADDDNHSELDDSNQYDEG
jgi:hypothetical protein